MTCVDPNPYFGPYLEQLRHKHPGIKFGDLIVAGAEDMSQIKDNLFDACVLSVVLCSAGDPTQCLQEMKRVLKPVSKSVRRSKSKLASRYPVRRFSSDFHDILQTLFSSHLASILTNFVKKYCIFQKLDHLTCSKCPFMTLLYDMYKPNNFIPFYSQN